ncbi:ABC transporter ATP-binding protein [Desulfosarcina ovata]|uniref:ABC transporter ATP-binding protein n=1 Tax=Desulfosarcina ovata subsp. ovata TaxID=2752305 RepID=A0A5K8ADH5_9BACT|nr:oligopeptide/dipeptide ABC transporter ATP-binding protein [Desulfosarcina ovata]BBO90621.1 ABC transporter ATP-binding protein [Desulfosarcina ovata subsp. ovata]
MTVPIIETRHLKKVFTVTSGLFSGDRHIHAVDDVSIAIREQEVFALVGESGCGKTTLGRVLLRLEEKSGGTVRFRGNDIHDLSESDLRGLRKTMQIIFQDPYASLNPRLRVRSILAEPLVAHGYGNRAQIDARVGELLRLVGLRDDVRRYYPHQFSGGQRQRIGIARALAMNPEFVVCDEAVSALDVSIQAQILNLLKDLQDRLKLTYLFITHDLSVVRHIADRVCVMFLGKTVELGATDDIFKHPRHPYTRFLISAVPVADPHRRNRERMILQGDIPSPMNLPAGCRFHTRCPYAQAICRREDPPLAASAGRWVACHFPLPAEAIHATGQTT